MDVNTIKELLAVLEHTKDITEIEVRDGEKSVRLCRAVAGSLAPMMQAPMPTMLQMPVGDAAAKDSTSRKSAETNVKYLRSPMVGTFYRASAPGARPFVDVGSEIKVGDVLCIIEAMKMLNQIEAEQTGVIKEILIENGQPVEFDQPLFVLA